MRSYILCFVFIYFLAGCATQQSVETQSLIPVRSPHVVVLKAPLLKINKSKSWATVDVTQGLLPGNYTSKVENNYGTFFYGNERCYFLHDTNSGKYYLREGGFWVPKSSYESPRVFYIVNSQKNVVTTPSLESAIRERTSVESVEAPPTMQPVGIAEGAGYGIGMGIVNALADSEAGNIVILSADSDNDFSSKLSSIITSSY